MPDSPDSPLKEPRRSSISDREEIAYLRNLLVKVQWSSEYRVDYDDTVPCCPVCDGIQPLAYAQREGRVDGGIKDHADDCSLALASGLPTRGDDE